MDRYKKGFTLIEIIIVVSIIGILSSILIPKYISYIDKANEAKAEQISKMIFVSAMRVYLNEDKFIKEQVSEAVNDDMNIEGLNINVKSPTQDGNTIYAEFNTGDDNYMVTIKGDNSTFTLNKN